MKHGKPGKKLQARGIGPSWLAGLGALVAGCGNATPVTSPDAVVAVPHASAAAESDVARPMRSFTAVDPNADVVFFVDAVRFRDTAFYEMLVDTLEAAVDVKAKRAEWQKACHFDPIDSLIELSGSANIEDDLVAETAVLAFQTVAGSEATMKCITALDSSFVPKKVGGKERLEGDQVEVFSAPPLIVMAHPEGLPRVMPRLSAKEQPPSPEDYFSLVVRKELSDEIKGGRYSLGQDASTKQTVMRLEVEFTDSSLAETYAQRISQVLENAPILFEEQLQGVQAKHRQLLLGLRDAFQLKRAGSRLSAVLNFGEPEQETALLGVLAGAAVYGVKRYVTNAKTSEARINVARIAKRLVAHAMTQRPPRFTGSATLVPGTGPTEHKYQSSADDWKQPGWTELDFSLEQPQYYAYEVETSKDGQHAVVRAKGDLDGDGILSEFSLNVDIQEGVAVVSEKFTEVRPNE